MKRVCLVRQKFYPTQRNLRRNGDALTQEGYEAHVICVGAKEQPRHEIFNGVNIHRIYFSYHRNNVLWYLFDYLNFFILASLKLARLSIKKRFDVIEVCNIPDFHIFTTLFPKLLGTKVIFYMFEKTEAVLATNFGLSRQHVITRIVNFFTKIVMHYADHIIFTDVLVQKTAIEHLGIPRSKTTLVLNVPDESVFNLEPAVSPGDNHHFNITIVSSILKRYGLQTMLQAVPLLIKDIPELKIHIIGGGEFLPRIRQMAQEMAIEPYFNITGGIPYEEVSAHIARADICVAPMIDDVGTPNKVLEYFALGKATVSSELPGLKALFNNDSIVYFHPGNEVELAERILELYHNPARRAALGRQAKEFHLKNQWPVTKQAYLEVYQRLLK
jgi:glycosyltransferase involved in cell wall biosynthesis